MSAPTRSTTQLTQIHPGVDSFTCPRCARTSWHPTDAREGYCGACHDWTGLRFGVIAEHNAHGGWGWTLIDRQARAVTGGWFVDRVAAERTAAVLNSQDAGADIHVTPRDDLREHEQTRTCWCGPTLETVNPATGRTYPRGAAVVVHHSADGRELVETHGLQ